jgi:hypothetical protein
VNTTASSIVVVAKPAGTAAGDVLVASIALNGTTVTTAPSGWVQIAAVTAITNPKLYAYYRVAGASEPATCTWTLAASQMNSGGIARYSGVNNTNPLDAPATSATTAAALNLAVPAVTTVSSGAMLIGAAAINSSSTTNTIAGPSGMTERWDLGGKRQDYADVIQATIGSSGNKTWTFSAPREAAGWLAALRPAQ